MNEIDYDEVVRRIGYFRNKANYSMRKASEGIDKNPQFFKTIENKSIELKVKTLLAFCKLVNIKPYEFFYMGKEYSEEDKHFFELFSSLSNENKKVITDLMKKLK